MLAAPCSSSKFYLIIRMKMLEQKNDNRIASNQYYKADDVTPLNTYKQEIWLYEIRGSELYLLGWPYDVSKKYIFDAGTWIFQDMLVYRSALTLKVGSSTYKGISPSKSQNTVNFHTKNWDRHFYAFGNSSSFHCLFGFLDSGSKL